MTKWIMMSVGREIDKKSFTLKEFSEVFHSVERAKNKMF